jgi:hypothetical protein
MPQRRAITDALKLIFEGRDLLKKTFADSHRNFTIDGRLVGDIGEVIAALEYDVRLDEKSQPTHDGQTSDGRKVQVKATFKQHLAFRAIPDYCLGFLLRENGTWEVVYNGPGELLRQEFQHRKDFGKTQISLPIARLRKLNEQVAAGQRIPLLAT